MEHLDLEATSELLVKISLAGIIKDNPNIDADRFINHLYEFYYRSQAINQEFLTRVRNKNPIFPNEASLTLEQFLYRTSSHPRFYYKKKSYKIYEYVLGFGSWRNASTNFIRPKVQRYLIWALDLTSIQKSLGWSTTE